MFYLFPDLPVRIFGDLRVVLVAIHLWKIQQMFLLSILVALVQFQALSLHNIHLPEIHNTKGMFPW